MFVVAPSGPGTITSVPATRPRDLSARIEERLQHGPYLTLRSVHCDLLGGTAVLRGQVPTYYLKQVAQTLAAQVEGVTAIVNRITVDVAPPGPASAMTTRSFPF